ncbi:MAG TPA: hypothetical protein VGG88_10165, partial [Gaiellaceae bacterium]
VRARPNDLVRVERDLVLSVADAGELHARVLPQLREAVAARRNENARELLGEDAWELLRPDRPIPTDRTAPGLALHRISALVDAIEKL